MSGKTSLIDHLFLRLTMVAGMGLVLLCLIWAAVEFVEFNRRSGDLRDAQQHSNRVYLKRMIDDVMETIAFERHRTEARVEASLRGRVDEAEAIIGNLLKTQQGKSRAELESIVRETLRPIRFNNGRGYYFAFDLNGIEKLFPLRPQLEGTNMLGQTGARGEFVVYDMLQLVQKNGGGLYRYYWAQPGKPGNDHLKFAYVRLIPDLNWVVGTGEYVEDMEADIKAELLERIGHMRFDQDGYIFVSQWDGLSLVGSLKGTNSLQSPHQGVRDGTIQLIATAKAGSGLVTYSMTDFKGGSVEKTSYVAGIPDWQWFVGAGMTHDRTEAEITRQRQILVQGLGIKAVMALLATILIGVVALLIMRRTSRRTAMDAQILTRAMAEAADSPHPIDTTALRFAEHHGFALSANQLIIRRQQVEKQLLDRTAQLEQTNADLERFAYVASHDLQEPLRTIGLFLQLLKRRVGDTLDAESREYIDFAVGGADRMRNNIQGLLAYSRSTHHGDERVQTDMDALLARVIGDLSATIAATGAHIEAAALPVLRINPDQMSALFQNLISNALRYRHPEQTPEVKISAVSRGDGVWEFAVADNGIGVPDDYRTAIFEPFRRFHPPGMEGGSGIGLALCRRVVEAHDGKIWVDADASGSTFRFTING
ncbi:cache domain-containing protein [Magnetospirillum gryphiswaldense]|nr:cache domain-containing protein [Magnetospirillum gryphiswaldense]